jgi:hypothetical protein
VPSIVTGVRLKPDVGVIVNVGSEGGGGGVELPLVTVSTAVPGTAEESVAVMTTAPVATPVASPLEETVADAGVEDDHVTLSVRFLVDRSE